MILIWHDMRKPNESSARSTSELNQDPFLNDIMLTQKRIRSIIYFYLDIIIVSNCTIIAATTAQIVLKSQIMLLSVHSNVQILC